MKSLPHTHDAAPLLVATASSLPEPAYILARARTFAEPLIGRETLDTGENTLTHADAVAAIVNSIGGSQAMQAASYLVYASQHLNRPEEVISKAFGPEQARLAIETTRLLRVQRQARAADVKAQLSDDPQLQTETVRKMLLAFSRDLRVVLLRLASRLQTLRHYAASRSPVPPALARESLAVFAPLANRLGIWPIKWELEDLAFRFMEPSTYREVAARLEQKRVEREAHVERLRQQLQADLSALGIAAQVQGRPKHIYSIVKKMRGKSLDFEQVFDVLALRVLVHQVHDCYAALAWVHTRFEPVPHEFDDYIAKPKPNGYQSLHTVVREKLPGGERGQPIEIQLRTQAMHEHAEHGVAAHWAYKEAGAKGYAGVSASGAYEAKIAVLRQLLAWERELAQAPGEASAAGAGHLDATQVLIDRIYVLTPQAAIVELPQGATPVDFAYAVHTSLGHRCRGARVDGALVPLNTRLRNGQTVEISTAKEGGPSRDWLNPDLGYLSSARARAKVRAWFNALQLQDTVARGREAVEKLLQREGKTATRLDELAARLGFARADELFELVGKDDFSLRSIEAVLRPNEPAPAAGAQPLLKKPQALGAAPKGDVLVVGVDSLLTQLAKCCKPAPPDAIGGFVTRGKGVSIHRADCSNLLALRARHGQRVIEVEWGTPKSGEATAALYPVDVCVQAADRQGLLRDISEVFAKEKINLVGAQTESVKGIAWMTFTVQVSNASRLARVLEQLYQVPGVHLARRR